MIEPLNILSKCPRLMHLTFKLCKISFWGAWVDPGPSITHGLTKSCGETLATKTEWFMRLEQTCLQTFFNIWIGTVRCVVLVSALTITYFKGQVKEPKIRQEIWYRYSDICNAIAHVTTVITMETVSRIVDVSTEVSLAKMCSSILVTTKASYLMVFDYI